MVHMCDSWPEAGNTCMLSSICMQMSKEQLKLITIGGKVDARHVMKEAMGVLMTDKLLRGISATDVTNFLELVVEKNRLRGKRVKFVWKRLGRNHGAGGKGWNVSTLKKSVLDVKVGKFVILARAKRNTQRHEKLVRAVKSCETEKEKLECWGRYAKGDGVPTHAIGIKVEEGKPTMLIDNGMRAGQKEFTVMELLKRVDDMRVCYELDVYEVK
jgi:hypothetical protein